jgi:hypothetical protein
MNTMSGVISVDRWVFGETSSPDLPHTVKQLGNSPAERHVRQLCASCHLGTPKESPGPVTEESRGGGCSACHLRYDGEALASLAQKGSPFPTGVRLVHPDISIHLSTEACLGCHSRSGRISLGFEGWGESSATGQDKQPQTGSVTRQMLDGRKLIQHKADIHHEKGLVCVDCHGALEVMGDGLVHLHQEEARRSSCTDCHDVTLPKGLGLEELDPETRTILRLSGQEQKAVRFVQGKRGQNYPNLRLAGGRILLVGKLDGRLHEARPMPASCGGRAGVHARLSCDSCHAAWAPQCTSCHTKEDPGQVGWDLLTDRETKGTWVERGGNQHADRPVLGLIRDAYAPKEALPVIGAFIPGMILHLQRGDQANEDFRRLYAPASPHTTRSEARSCEECHLEPLALGYGRGSLLFEVSGRRGRWRFTPALPLLKEDGLPEDAWIPFLGEATQGRSTRESATPLGLEEQKRILRVGSCLSCHPSTDTAFRLSLLDFPAILARRSPRCAEPDWEGH